MRAITHPLRLLPLLAALSLFTLIGCGRSAPLTGTSLGRSRVRGFRLRDEKGRLVSLADFRGKVVVLSFLYTHCTDYCPLTAELLRHADEAAGRPSNVEYLAVSVDPIGDTPESIATFEQQHHMEELGDRWHYLVGTEPELAGGLAQLLHRRVGWTAAGEAGHTSALYFIDRKGNRRVVTELDAGAEAIARNALVLARQ